LFYLFLTVSAKDYGLFLADEDIKKGVWLEPGRNLEYYILRNGVSQFLFFNKVLLSIGTVFISYYVIRKNVNTYVPNWVINLKKFIFLILVPIQLCFCVLYFNMKYKYIFSFINTYNLILSFINIT